MIILMQPYYEALAKQNPDTAEQVKQALLA
jgi:hypothetical protein